MTIIDEIVPTPSSKVQKALWVATLNALDRKGYVPCSLATATQNATITLIMGVECYSKTDVCRTSQLPAGATTANPLTQGDASRSGAQHPSVDTMPTGAR